MDDGANKRRRVPSSKYNDSVFEVGRARFDRFELDLIASRARAQMGGNEGVTLMDGSLGTLESPPSDGRDRRRRHRQHHDARDVRQPLVVNAELVTQKVSARARAAAPHRARGRGAFKRVRQTQVLRLLQIHGPMTEHELALASELREPFSPLIRPCLLYTSPSPRDS